MTGNQRQSKKLLAEHFQGLEDEEEEDADQQQAGAEEEEDEADAGSEDELDDGQGDPDQRRKVSHAKNHSASLGDCALKCWCLIRDQVQSGRLEIWGCSRLFVVSLPGPSFYR